MNRPLRYAWIGLIAIVGWGVLGCSTLQPRPPERPVPPVFVPTEAPNPAIPDATATATATPTPPLPAAATATPEMPPTPLPAGGDIELRFTDPETRGECVARFSFGFDWGAEPATMDGPAAFSCAFEVVQCGDGVCVTYHSRYELPDGVLRGVLHPAGTGHPNGTLDVTLAGAFKMIQYWTDVPPETIMPFTEDNPFVVENADILPLLFDFADGATAEIGAVGSPEAWCFTLHLR